MVSLRKLRFDRMMSNFKHFIAALSFVTALLCAISALDCIIDRDWLRAIWYVALTAANHYNFNLWRYNIKKDVHGSSNDKRDNAE